MIKVKDQKFEEVEDYLYLYYIAYCRYYIPSLILFLIMLSVFHVSENVKQII